MRNRRPVNTPGTAALKSTDNEAPVAADEHKLYWKAAVGDIHQKNWLEISQRQPASRS